MASTAGFIERHGLWTQDQKLQAAEIAERLAREDIHLVRLAWADPHGYSRAKVASPHWGLAKRPEGFHGHRLRR